MPYPCITEMNIDDINFSKAYIVDGKTRIDISTPYGKKLIFNLCTDFQEPMLSKFPLDALREDARDRNKRGQAITLSDQAVLKQLHALDERLIKCAVKNAKDWFKSKTELTENTIRDRYEPLVKKQEDGTSFMKFKVKMPTAAVPTRMHIMRNGKIGENKGSVADLEVKDVPMAPILSSFGVWLVNGKFGISMQAEEIVYKKAEGEPLSNFSSKRPFEMEGDEDVSSKVVCLQEE